MVFVWDAVFGSDPSMRCVMDALIRGVSKGSGLLWGLGIFHWGLAYTNKGRIHHGRAGLN